MITGHSTIKHQLPTRLPRRSGRRSADALVREAAGGDAVDVALDYRRTASSPSFQGAAARHARLLRRTGRLVGRVSRPDAVLHSLAWVLSILLVLPLCAPAQEAGDDAGWISLFNGENLEGWTVKIAGHDLNDNYGDTFRVEDGVLKVSYDHYDQFNNKFGHIFYKDKFSHYRLRVEYRFVGDQCPGGAGWALRNSGIMVHSQSPESMRKDQSFPVSIEVQLLGGNGRDERTTANVCSPGTHIVMNGELVTRHCNSSRSKTYHGDQWVTVEVEVRGNSTIKHIIDGEVVLEYEKPQLDENDGDAKKLIEANNGDKMLHEGYISLQSESHPIEFQKVEILPLAE
jgi:hypothetical protein